jgi:hypothetical protein
MIRPGQMAEKRIELMGNSRKEIAGLPDRQPRRVKHSLRLSTGRLHHHGRRDRRLHHQYVALGGALR